MSVQYATHMFTCVDRSQQRLQRVQVMTGWCLLINERSLRQNILTTLNLKQTHAVCEMQAGDWVCLKNLHLVVAWLPSLEKELSSLQPHPDFRLCLTTEPHDDFPPLLLQQSLKVNDALLE